MPQDPTHMHEREDPEEHKAHEHDRWVSMASVYDNGVVKAGLMKGLYAHFISALSDKFKDAPTFRVLDVASASGEPAASIAAALPHTEVISTDFSEPYLELGKARAQELGLTNISFETADGEDLHQFPDASFDVVTCSLGLMFMPNHGKALSEFRRVLKPGGSLAVSFWGALDKVPFIHTICKLTREFDPEFMPPEGPPLTAFNLGIEEVMAECIAAGFEKVLYHPYWLEYDFGENWFENILKMPLPLTKAVATAKIKGQENAYEVAKVHLEESFKESGWFTAQGSGDDFVLRCPNNLVNFILADVPKA